MPLIIKKLVKPTMPETGKKVQGFPRRVFLWFVLVLTLIAIIPTDNVGG